MFNRPTPADRLFWLVMNALLWRAEFGGGNEAASSAPPMSFGKISPR
jgi:hypothetical protein